MYNAYSTLQCAIYIQNLSVLIFSGVFLNMASMLSTCI